MTHVPPPAEWRDKMKWQQVTSTITSHDHLPRSLSVARRVMTALPPPKCHHNSTQYLPAIKEAIKTSDTIYINLHTRRRVSLLYLVKGQLIYLSPKPWLTKPSEGASGCPFCRYNDWIKNLFWLRSRIHPFGNYVEHQEREVSTKMALKRREFRTKRLAENASSGATTPFSDRRVSTSNINGISKPSF